MSHARLIRFLATQGWTLLREGGRHTVVGRGGTQVAVPRHGKLKLGTLAVILKQCGIADWWAL